MKLYWSSRSPFARKVMVAAREVGIADRIRTQLQSPLATPPLVAHWRIWTFDFRLTIGAQDVQIWQLGADFSRRPSVCATEFADVY